MAETIRTHVANENYRKGWDAAFGKKRCKITIGYNEFTGEEVRIKRTKLHSPNPRPR